MPLTLTAGHSDPAGPVSLLETVTGFLDENLQGSGGTVSVCIKGTYRPAEPPARPVSDTTGSAAGSAAFHHALARLHRAGHLLACVSDGTVGGIWLEIALAADIHLMTARARLVPAGLLDTHRPLCGGWARLIDRAGGSRAAALLLNAWGESLDADAALQAGLADRLVPDADTALMVMNENATSPRATRLAGELCARSGGLTPRQARLMERASFALAFASTDPRTGIEAFFSGTPNDWTPNR